MNSPHIAYQSIDSVIRTNIQGSRGEDPRVKDRLLNVGIQSVIFSPPSIFRTNFVPDHSHEPHEESLYGQMDFDSPPVTGTDATMMEEALPWGSASPRWEPVEIMSHQT